jgi:para-nitrobenzyl esterase
MAMHQAKTEYGVVEGLPAGNPSITVFKGIPFAAPPVGELRWKAPKPPKPWDGILNAYTFPGLCPQQIVVSNTGLTGGGTNAHRPLKELMKTASI